MRRFYISTKRKFLISLVLALIWSFFSIWIARSWANDLGQIVSMPFAWIIIIFIAIIPGFLNINLIISIILDHPPKLLFKNKLPAITILIAAYNEEDSIEETIRGLRNQSYPGRFKVIMVDDGSTDNTIKKTQKLTKDFKGFSVLKAKHGGKANALNFGIKRVKTRIVVTIDADTFLHPEALKRIVTRFMQSPPKTIAVAGTVLVKNSRKNFLAQMQEWDYFCAIASVKRQQGLFQGTLVAQGAFSAFITEAIRDVGGWPDVLGEDIVATWALLKRGYSIGFEPTALGFTVVPTEFRKFVRQRERWARGMIEGLKRHGDIVIKRPGIPSFFISIDFLFPLLDGFTSFVLIPGIVLAIFGKFWIVGPVTVLVLPITFAIIAIMIRKQKKVFGLLGLKIRKNILGLIFYVLIYQFMLSPVSFFGYFKEIFKTRKKW